MAAPKWRFAKCFGSNMQGVPMTSMRPSQINKKKNRSQLNVTEGWLVCLFLFNPFFSFFDSRADIFWSLSIRELSQSQAQIEEQTIGFDANVWDPVFLTLNLV